MNKDELFNQYSQNFTVGYGILIKDDSKQDIMEYNRNMNLIVLSSAILSLMVVAVVNSPGFVFAKQKFTGTMTGGEEVPPVSTKATGLATFTTQNNDTSIKYKLNITGLSDATGAHIHSGKKGENGDVIVDLLKNSKHNPTKIGMAIRGNITDSSLTGPMKGKTVGDLISAMSSGDTYANVHTQKHTKGEIRGQIEMSEAASSNATSAMSMNETSTMNATG